MGAALEFPLIALLICTVGLLVLRIGWRRRTGDAPFCRKCGYNLSGAVRPECAECGRDLTRRRSIVRGERRASPALLGLGGVLLAIGAPLLVIAVTEYVGDFNWLRLKPTRWLLQDLKIAGADRTRVSFELIRRHKAGQLSPDELDAFGRAVFSVTAAVRPKMKLEETYPIEFSTVGSLPGYLPLAHLEFIEHWIDGERQPTTPQWQLSIQRLYRPGRLDSPFRPQRLGAGELRLVARIREEKLGIDFTQPITLPVEVVAEDVTVVDGAATAAALRRALRPKSVEFFGGYWWMRFERSSDTHIGMKGAFEVFGQISGSEQALLGRIVVDENGNIQQLSNAPTNSRQLESVRGRYTMDIVLKPCPSAARQTLDIFEIPEVTLEYQDVSLD